MRRSPFVVSIPSAGVAGIAEDSTGPIRRTEKYKAVGDSDLGARARGVLGYQLRGQCPQAILQTPLLHQLQRVRGLKLRIEGKQAGAGASTPLVVRLDKLGALLVPSGAKRAGHIECGLCHAVDFRWAVVAP